MYEFGSYRIDPSKRVLLRGEETVQLPSKAFETLLVLVQHSEEVVSKDDLLKTVWPDSFVEESNLSQSIFLLRKALGETAQDHRYIVTIPGRGYRFAERVRETSVGATDLVVQSRSIQTITTREEKPLLSPQLLWIGLALLSLAGLLAYHLYVSPRTYPATPSATLSSPSPRRSVAVLGFRNLSGRPEEDWLSTALREMLSTELAAGEKLRLVSGENIARAKLDFPVADADSLSRDTLARLRKNLGTDLVVLGSYTALGKKFDGRIRLDLRLQDATAGETIADVAVAGTESDLFDLVAQAGARLREKLGVEAASPVELVSVRASLPSSREAARLYSEGLARLRVFDAAEARGLLQQSVTADPKYPLSHSGLAEAWSRLGYDKKAQEEAGRAYQLATNLSREERLVVEGRYRETNHEYGKAMDVYRSLFTLFPDNLDYGLMLAAAQSRGGKGHDAVATIDALRKLPPEISEDPRIDLEEAHAWNALSDFTRQREPLQRAVEKGKAAEARLIVAEAREQQCWMFSYLEQEQDAIVACREARDIFASAGDSGNEASTLRNWASAIGHSDALGAIRLSEQALVILRRIGFESGVASVLNNMGNRYEERGDESTAEKMYREAQAIYRKLDDRRRLAVPTLNIGNTRMKLGDLPGASRFFEESLELSRTAGDKGNAAIAGFSVATVHELQGDLVTAKQGFEECLRNWKEAGDQYDSTAALDSLGDLLKIGADFNGARKMYEQSLALKNSAKDQIDIALSHLNLAELSLEEGQAVPSLETAVRDANNVFLQTKRRDDEARGQAVLARALLAEGKAAEAKTAMQRAEVLGSKSQNVEIRWRVAIAAARTAGVGKDHTATLLTQKQLAAIIDQAERRGFFGVELDARLALAELEMKAGQTLVARTHLAAVETDAKAKGYDLVARRAATP